MRRRLTRREKNKRSKQIIMVSTICLLVVMVSGYAAFQTNLNITAKGNIKEQSRVIQSWNANNQTDFHSDYYKENIVSATFLDNVNVPDNAIEKWNISEDKKHGGVMAWVVPNNNNNTKYDLYIGADGGVIANEYSHYLFENFVNIKTINFNGNFDTSNVISMERMFCNCKSLITIDLSSFDTSSLVIMAGMFQMFNIITQTDTSSQLEQIIFGDNFNTNKVISMSSLFYHCNSLKEVDLSSFNTSNVTNMSGMFYSCSSLSTLDLNSFNTAKVTSMYAMFWNARSLTTLHVENFDTSNVLDMRRLFMDTPSLSCINVGAKWTTVNANTTDMFTNSGVSSVTSGAC